MIKKLASIEEKVDMFATLPKHWVVKKLGYITSLKSGETITADIIEEQGIYPVYGGNGLRGYTESFTHSGDYVLIGRQGALCGNINYAHGDFWASEHAVVATPIEEYDYRWLGNALQAMNLNQ
jgi:type I restriction enzyme, S subunit